MVYSYIVHLNICSLNMLIILSTEAHCFSIKKILQRIETLYQYFKCTFHQTQGCLHHVDMLAFFIFVFADAVIFFFAIFVLVTVDVVYVKSVKLKHIYCLYHFL